MSRSCSFSHIYTPGPRNFAPCLFRRRLTLKTQNISWQHGRMSVLCVLMTYMVTWVHSSTVCGHFCPGEPHQTHDMTLWTQEETSNGEAPRGTQTRSEPQSRPSVHTVLVAVQPGRKETAGPGRAGHGLRQAHHPRRAPHLDGGVVAGRQQQLLVGRAEGHRVHYVVVCQTCQADVVMTIPDVAVLVLCSALHKHSKERILAFVLPKWHSHMCELCNSP